ncbi:hypothetical protein V1283_006330 [Bradyrhizobium sp. AZCC 2262]|uniref:hypothetical protein n=1 Tax=Bradyrhizobium sp. AZCC 2262 TaxID=3117022 RepID=UPI002FF34AED
MDWLDKTTIQLGAQVTSTLVALLALFIGLRNEARNQKRFERQLSLSQQAASAAARPLLAIEREGYEDVKAVTITNHGPGTAVCRVIKFVRRKRKRQIFPILLSLMKPTRSFGTNALTSRLLITSLASQARMLFE